MRDKKIEIIILVIIILSLVGIGIAFAAFSQTLTINGTGTVDASSWQVVFEGADGSNTIGAPTLVGTATEVTRPTIKNNSTEISSYEVTLKSPGDSVTYNFKIHNKGDYAANLSSLRVAGVDNPGSEVYGTNLITSDYSSIPSGNRNAFSHIFYSFYYTQDNILVGLYPGKDCLEPGESVNVSLKLMFKSFNYVSHLPKSNITLDNLGITAVYNQTDNGSCQWEAGEAVINAPFSNNDRLYYRYEGKTFIGTGVDNVILAENIISKSKYSSTEPTECSDGSEPVVIDQYGNKDCPNGSTPVLSDHLAVDAAAAYCTGCRLMTLNEVAIWTGCTISQIDNWECRGNSKIIGKYNNKADYWHLADIKGLRSNRSVYDDGRIGWGNVTANLGIRPAVSIPSTATMTGSGTKTDPYVIIP